jgi:hypothetical protein
MIARETVFVLGAGASVPYGFPTGVGLRQKICGGLQSGNDLWQRFIGTGIDGTAIAQFRHEFERSGVTSIDSFIARRQEFKDLGELAIAAALLPNENELKLYQSGGVVGSGDWYQALWNLLLSGINSPEELPANRVKIITFNYDRSLELFLLNGIKHAFGLPEADAFALLTRLSIHHVYGSLGEYEPGKGYRYGDTSNEMMAKAKASIKTVPWTRPDVDWLAADWLATARRVFIMGFGFDRVNCARINLPGAIASSDVNPPPIFATDFDLTRSEIDLYTRYARKPGAGGCHWIKGDCLNLIRASIEYLA